jgi:K+-transporting ATPase KdpF subunit
VKEFPMLFEYILGGAVTAGILVYLTYALLCPEKL